MARLGPEERTVFRAVRAACYQGLSMQALLQSLHEMLGPALRADATCTVMLDPDTSLPTYSVSRGWEDWHHQPLIEKALLRSPTADVPQFVAEGRRVVNAESCVVDGDIQDDPYFQYHIFLGGYRHELMVPCVTRGRGRLLFTVNRRAANGSFDTREYRLLDALIPHIAAAVNAATIREALDVKGRSDYGFLLLDEQGEVEMANGAGEQWLRLSGAASELGRSWVIQVLRMLLARSEEDDVAPPCLVVPDPENGYPVQIHAERSVDNQGRPRTVILFEPVRATDRPEVLDRLGLTPREGQVTMAVVKGQDLGQFAQSHALSRHTVGEHLRNVYDKLGVSSRPELAARLMAWT